MGCGDAMDWPDDCEKFLLEILAERIKKDPNGAPVFKGTDWKEMDDEFFYEICFELWS